MRIAPAVVLLFPGSAGARAQSSQYAVGADVSFVKAAEDSGKVFKDNGQAKPAVEILKDHGYNWVRLRVFRTPKELPNNLQYTIALASPGDSSTPTGTRFPRFASSTSSRCTDAGNRARAIVAYRYREFGLPCLVGVCSSGGRLPSPDPSF